DQYRRPLLHPRGKACQLTLEQREAFWYTQQCQRSVFRGRLLGPTPFELARIEVIVLGIFRHGAPGNPGVPCTDHLSTGRAQRQRQRTTGVVADQYRLVLTQLRASVKQQSVCAVPGAQTLIAAARPALECQGSEGVKELVICCHVMGLSLYLKAGVQMPALVCRAAPTKAGRIRAGTGAPTLRLAPTGACQA